jgi:hypothetical protein
VDVDPQWVRMLRRGWLLGAVLVGLGLLLLAGHLSAPAPAPARAPGAHAPGPRPSCDPSGLSGRAAQAPTDGPEQRPPVRGLRLEPAATRPGQLPAARAAALARILVPGGDDVVVHTRLFSVTYPAAQLRRTPAWVVAVAGLPIGQGFCGSLGTREQVVVLHARDGRELLRYSYR